MVLFSLYKGAIAQKVPSPALTADSLATGNYKDVLNSFFQLSFDKLTGPDKELKFTSTPFAVMARLDTNLLLDENYLKYRTLRNINFSFSTKLDSVYKFNGFSSGIKYAIVNKRDETVSRAFVELVANNEAIKEFYSLNNSLDAYISALPNAALKAKLMLEKTEFTRGNKNFDELDNSLQQKIIEIAGGLATKNLSTKLAANKKFNIFKSGAEIYESMKKQYNNNLLWTIGVTDTTYKDEFLFSNIVFSSELLKGINNTSDKNDVELNIKTALQITDDTLKTGRDLKRVVFSFEPGINFVLKTKTTGKSFLEIKFSGGYYHNFSTLYVGEEKEKVTLNSVIRVRILNDIWIPLEIKLDPKEGRVFGSLNIKANFTALGKVANFLKI